MTSEEGELGDDRDGIPRRSRLHLRRLRHRAPEQREELIGLLRRAEEGGIQAVVSTFCIAEVRKLTDDDSHPEFSQAEADRVRRMFREGDLVVRPLTEHIAFKAQDIGNEFPQLLPGDCVHIATAIQFGVDALFTRDGSGLEGRRRPGTMLFYDGQIEGLRIVEPFNPMGPLLDHPRMNPRRFTPWYPAPVAVLAPTAAGAPP